MITATVTGVAQINLLLNMSVVIATNAVTTASLFVTAALNVIATSTATTVSNITLLYNTITTNIHNYVSQFGSDKTFTNQSGADKITPTQPVQAQVTSSS